VNFFTFFRNVFPLSCLNPDLNLVTNDFGVFQHHDRAGTFRQSVTRPHLLCLSFADHFLICELKDSRFSLACLFSLSSVNGVSVNGRPVIPRRALGSSLIQVEEQSSLA
jgi:hypothetical protein